jgi:hypothetical protein
LKKQVLDVAGFEMQRAEGRAFPLATPGAN